MSTSPPPAPASRHIRPITAEDRDAFAAWRRACWPQRVGARSMDVMLSKYVDHPATARCPGAALYGYFATAGEILGVLGAFPFPVRLRGREIPGHALVDWAVLPRVRAGAVGGKLLRFGLDLPGLKFGIGGGEDSLPTLQSRARPVEGRLSLLVLDPLRALAARKLGMFAALRPAAVEGAPPGAEDLALLERLLPGDGDASSEAGPDRDVARHSVLPGDVLHILREAHLTGARLWRCPDPEGFVVVSLRAAGKLLGAHVLLCRTAPGADRKRFSRWFRARLDAVDAAYVAVHDTPDNRAAGLLRHRGPRLRRTETHWVFACPADRAPGGEGPPPGTAWAFEGIDTDQLWIAG